MPLPVPEAPAAIAIHASLLVAVQPHPVDALIVTMLEPPDAEAVVDDGESAETQETPTCVTVKSGRRSSSCRCATSCRCWRRRCS